MRYDELRVAAERDGALVRLTLPGGALSRRAAAELTAAAEAVVEDRAVRLVVLDAAGDDFCTGPEPGFDPASLRRDPPSALADLRPPVVALLRGRCASVGLEVALACDVRIGVGDVQMGWCGLGEGRLPAWGGVARLVRAVGVPTATALLYLDGVLDAPGALSCGLLHQVGDADAVIERLVGLAPLALELAKEAVWRGADLPLRDGLRLEGDLNTLLAHTADRAEGLAAFFEKRPPTFRGR